jgi:heptosyltransferase III
LWRFYPLSGRSMAELSFIPQRILISNIRLIGDVILTSPLVALLKKQWPEVKIDFLANRGTGEFLESDSRIHTVIFNEKKGQRKNNSYLKRIFRQYDIAINMNASERGNIAVALAGKTIRIGYRDEEHTVKRWLWDKVFTHHLPAQKGHIVLRCAQIAAALGIRVEKLEVTLPFLEADKRKVSEVLSEVGCAGDYFVVHPFARWEYKYWTPEGFAQCSDAVAEKYGWTPVWTSSPDAKEVEILLETAKLCRVTPKLLPGRLNLAQMSALLSESKFYLGLDTAISHIAATYSDQMPMVALYGPTFIKIWHPWNNLGAMEEQIVGERGVQRNGNIVTVQSEKSCVPCGWANCDDKGVGKSPCLQEIGMERVIGVIDLVLGQKMSAI